MMQEMENKKRKLSGKIFCTFCKVNVDYQKNCNYFGNNPKPLKNTGRACDWCDANLVIPFRIRLLVIQEQNGKQ